MDTLTMGSKAMTERLELLSSFAVKTRTEAINWSYAVAGSALPVNDSGRLAARLVAISEEADALIKIVREVK